MDEQAVGRHGPEFEMDIERGKVREFARAVGLDDPSWWADPQPVIPPTFLTTQLYWQGEASNPWELAGVDIERALHAEQEYEFFGPPPRAGDVLRAQTRIDRVYSKPGRSDELHFVVVVTEFRDNAGELVAVGRMTGVEMRAGS
jgi:hypothetical protein